MRITINLLKIKVKLYKKNNKNNIKGYYEQYKNSI